MTYFKKGEYIVHFPLRLSVKLHKQITEEAEENKLPKHRYIIEAIIEKIERKNT